MFPATLFDFNGVLVDDELVHLEAFRDTVRPLGIEIGREEYFEKYLGFDDVGAFEALLDAAGIEPTPELVARLVEEKRPHYRSRAQVDLRTFPGAAELVRQRSTVGQVLVVSGALADEIEFGLSFLGVRGLVRGIISAEDTQKSKPDPEGYLLAIQALRPQLGPFAERALVIEDSLDGIRAAKAAHLTCIAVGHSYERGRLYEVGADWAVDHIADIDQAGIVALYQRLYG